MVEAAKAVRGAFPKSPSNVAVRKDTTGEICRLFSEGKCRRGARCKRHHDDRHRDPSPNTAARIKADRENRVLRRRVNESRDASTDFCLR